MHLSGFMTLTMSATNSGTVEAWLSVASVVRLLLLVGSLRLTSTYVNLLRRVPGFRRDALLKGSLAGCSWLQEWQNGHPKYVKIIPRLFEPPPQANNPESAGHCEKHEECGSDSDNNASQVACSSEDRADNSDSDSLSEKLANLMEVEGL